MLDVVVTKLEGLMADFHARVDAFEEFMRVHAAAVASVETEVNAARLGEAHPDLVAAQEAQALAEKEHASEVEAHAFTLENVGHVKSELSMAKDELAEEITNHKHDTAETTALRSELEKVRTEADRAVQAAKDEAADAKEREGAALEGLAAAKAELEKVKSDAMKPKPVEVKPVLSHPDIKDEPVTKQEAEHGY